MLSDVKAPEGIDILTSPEEVIVTIALPTATVEETDAEEEVTEPEVIGEETEE